MIANHPTDVVFIADTLEPQFPNVSRGLETILNRHGIPLGIIPGTRSVWCRDYMPVQVTENRFVQFRYAPDYLTGKYRRMRADGKIGRTLPWIKNCVATGIVLDGGNVVRWGTSAIVTDKIYHENPGIDRTELRERLRELLCVHTLIVIRKEPFDPIGHADGMVRWLDERRVVLNDYTVVGEPYRAKLRHRLEEFGLEVIEIPYRPPPHIGGGIPSAVGTWINFLRVGQLIVVPTFGIDGDRLVLRMLRERCPHLIVKGLDSRDLAKEGGVINCVTWQLASATSI